MTIIHKLTVDLARRNPQGRIDAVQGDTCARVLALMLQANGIPWSIPEDVQPLIRYRKADGTGGEYDTLPDGRRAWIADGNMLLVTLGPQVLATAGETSLSVQLIAGQSCISTFDLTLYVQPDLLGRITKPDPYHPVTGFVPAPEKAYTGQQLRIRTTDKHGHITSTEAFSPDAYPEEALAMIGAKIMRGEFSSVVLLGDSITDGIGGNGYNGTGSTALSTNAAGYCWANAFKKLIEERYGIPVSNCGMAGTLMSTQRDQILDRLTEKDFVIWLTGTNDRMAADAYRANFLATVNSIREKCAGVLMVSSIPATLTDEYNHAATMQQMDEIILQEAAGHAPCFSMYQAFIRECELSGIALNQCFADNVHPNDEGYYLMLRILCRKLGIPLDPYTDYRMQGLWWSAGAGPEVLLMSNENDWPADRCTEGIYLYSDIVPCPIMTGYDAATASSILSGRIVTRVRLFIYTPGRITIGTTSLQDVGKASPSYIVSKEFHTNSTGFVDFQLDMEVGADQTLMIQSVSDTAMAGFFVLYDDPSDIMRIWKSSDFAANNNTTTLTLHGAIYAR